MVYIADSRYTHTQSRYSGETITNVSSVNRPSLLTLTENTQQIGQLKKQLAKIQEQVIKY